MEGWPEREGDSADLVAASPYEPEGSPPSSGGNARESLGEANAERSGATLPLLTNCQTGGLKWDFSASWQLQQLKWREREGDSEDLVAASPYEPGGSPPSKWREREGVEPSQRCEAQQRF